jgi:uncharacterized phage protein gp47/JayE
MQLPLQNFATLVSNAAAAVQGAASQLLDLTVGSALRAVLEANASVALWLQWLIVLLLQTTRAATSAGPDLDTWMADFSLVRLPAVTAAGQVQFSRFVATTTALVPVGTQVLTADGTQTFAVTTDTTNTAWQASLNGYTLAAGTATVSVPVAAVVAGSAGNVQAGSITLIAAAIPGVDTVANAQPTAGGVDAESDPAFRARFQLFLAALSRATPLAIGSAVLSTRQGLSYAIAENVSPAGAPLMGSFVVTVDDGTGYPAQATLTAAAQAIDAVRPVGTSYAVVPPSVVDVTVTMVVVPLANYTHDVVAAAVSTAITDYIDTLSIGTALPYSRLMQVAYDASPGVANVMALLVAGGTADVSPGAGGVIKASSVQVS